jgi:hypothetical protein
MEDYCTKCSGGVLLVIGVLTLLNGWFSIINWFFFIGGLLVLIGITAMVKPGCGCGGYCCAPPMDAPVVKRKR